MARDTMYSSDIKLLKQSAIRAGPALYAPDCGTHVGFCASPYRLANAIDGGGPKQGSVSGDCFELTVQWRR